MSENERVALDEAIDSQIRIAIDCITRAQDQLRGNPSRTGWDYVHTQIVKGGNAVIEAQMFIDQLREGKKKK
jgi:hypothetical protein